jgi:hypothetical protein
MKIYINNKNEIKSIYTTDDETLTEIEVDRELVFGDMSDFMILNYCYKIEDEKCYKYPSRNYSDIVEEDYRLKIDESQKKISILQEENKNLKTEQEQQNKDILINMLATTEMYEINRSLNISTLESDSEVKTIKKAPTYIQCIYQKLYELGIKKLKEIPFEIRINLKAK